MQLEVEFLGERWIAEHPSHEQRVQLAHVGFQWDRKDQVWFTQDDEIALRGMSL